MSGGRIKLDLDSILQGYGFLTMLPSGDLLNFGNTGNNHLPLAILVSICVLGYTQEGPKGRFGWGHQLHPTYSNFLHNSVLQ